VGVYGLIIPDLPLDEDAPFRKTLSACGIHLIALVAPNTSLERMKAYAEVATGYVYVISVLGITGVRSEFPPDLSDTLRRARQAFRIPLALGFGFSSPEQLDAIPVTDRPDGIIFGSALVRHVEAGQPVADFMRRWVGKV
jgi:tryptophan synthase alpha chain